MWDIGWLNLNKGLSRNALGREQPISKVDILR